MQERGGWPDPTNPSRRVHESGSQAEAFRYSFWQKISRLIFGPSSDPDNKRKFGFPAIHEQDNKKEE